ncbi:AMP-binding protein (plasmid) [Streptomyces sp. NBC_01340]|uniref:class I adenylate-forming enzyme family protein n=1 Tax=Streptomyces sp. NBC_01340 TaxID=2903830 RepID=UPI002E0E6647|nr:AMP-binding protein [Streptomyces sp. NBC_01340]
MPFSPNTLRTPDERSELLQNDFGGGNAWRRALKASRTPDTPVLFSDRPLVNADGESQQEFSLSQLCNLADSWSLWYIDRGVQPRDRVAVYIEDSFEDQIHLTALAQVGAIPVLINGRMPPETALGVIERAGAIGLYTDPAHLALLDGAQDKLPQLRWTSTREDIGVLGQGPLPESALFQHSDNDPVVLCHTSGTTGNPKLVIWSHRQSVAGARFRLSVHPEPDNSVMLSAVAQSHSGAIAFTFYALLAGLPLVTLTDRDPANLSRAAAAHRPTTIMAFHPTFAALATSGPSPEDFSSVEYWLNTGDSAHDTHIRTLIGLGRHTADGQTVPGSVFGDSLGASELGWGPLRRVITRDTPPRARHIGQPVPIAEVTVLREDGSYADAGETGLLAVRSESLSPGYWNDSDTFYRSWLNGYRLTGDLAYRDVDGEFFHVDRVIDRIRTSQGDGHSVLMEEILLLHVKEIADCVVVAGVDGEETVSVAVVRSHDAGADPADLLRRANSALTAAGQPELAVLEIAVTDADIPVGPTEKTLKRQLREKYADLPVYLAAATPDRVATNDREGVKSQ